MLNKRIILIVIGLIMIIVSRISTIPWKLSLWVLLPLGILFLLAGTLKPLFRNLMQSINKLSVKKFLCLLIIATVILGLLWILAVPSAPASDGRYYHDIAKFISSGGEFKINERIAITYAYGYPIFLSLFYFFFGSSFIIAKLVNIFLSVIICLFIYLLGQKFFNENVGRIGSLAWVFYPNTVAYTSLFQCELLYTALFLIVIYVYVVQTRLKGILKSITLGVLIGLLCLVRPVFLLLPIVFLFYDFIRKVELKTVMRNFVVVVLLCFMVILPITVRNYIVFKEFILISNAGGGVLYIGNNPAADGRNNLDYIPGIENNPLFKIPDKIERYKALKKAAIHYIYSHPLRTLSLVPRRFYYMYRFELWGLIWSINHSYTKLSGNMIKLLYVLSQVAYFCMMILAGKRLISGGKGNPNVILIFMLILYVTGIYCFLFFGNERYRFVLLPLFMLLAASTFCKEFT